MTGVEFAFDAARLEVQPGDVLVIRVPKRNANADTAHRIRVSVDYALETAHIRDVSVLVMSDEVTVCAISQPSDEDRVELEAAAL